ncbi:hypothetical protein FJZ53_05220 [Candidatus Woesearchaeota archaeon]|nr:hypothetical protein [Candidatus Woesearchaeota archaeon]
MKRIAYAIVGIALMASVGLAKDLQIHVTRNQGIIMVCNKETLNKNYVGDVFYHYRQENSEWVKDKMTYLGGGKHKREFEKKVTTQEVPTYVSGLSSLYYDPDQDEENLVAVFEDGISQKVKEAWIETAKKHIKHLNST